MSIEDRLRLARFAYIRAVALAKSDPGPGSWARVLTAARNLRDAIRDRERAEARSPHHA